MEVISLMAYRLPDTYKGYNILNIQHLTKYHRSPDESRPRLANPRDALPSSEEYEVERIVGEKQKNGKLYYQIRWKGYDAEDDTWQSARDICNAPELLKAWCNRLWCQAQLGKLAHPHKNCQVIDLIYHHFRPSPRKSLCILAIMSLKQHESASHRIGFEPSASSPTPAHQGVRRGYFDDEVTKCVLRLSDEEVLLKSGTYGNKELGQLPIEMSFLRDGTTTNASCPLFPSTTCIMGTSSCCITGTVNGFHSLLQSWPSGMSFRKLLLMRWS